MTMISIVMLSAFVAIYIITSSNIQKQNNLKLKNISSSLLGYREKNEESTIVYNDVPSNGYIQAFSVVIDEDGNHIFDNTFGFVSKDMILKAIDVAKNQNKDSGKIILSEKLFLFSIDNIFAKIDSCENVLESNLIEEKLFQITFLDITDSEKTLSQLRITFIIISILMMFAILAVSMYFAKCSVAPIEQAYMKQKQFVQDASHELKTPIASISANLEVLKSNQHETVESQQKWIGYINCETDRMNKLVNDLLYLARTEVSEIATEEHSFNISDVVNNSIFAMEAVAYEKGLQVNHCIEPDIIVNGDRDKIEQVLKILLDNAIKYIDDYGNIDVKLHCKKNQVIISVANTGKGIPKEHITRIFDRFYRVDTSRKHSGSYGLGLSIAKTLVESMNGQIFVSSILNEKTTFSVKLNHR